MKVILFLILFLHYLTISKANLFLLDLKPILNHFKNPNDYKKFVFDQIDYGKKLKKLSICS